MGTNKKDSIRELQSKSSDVRKLIDELKSKTQNQLPGGSQTPLLPEKSEVATKGEYAEILNDIQSSSDGVKSDVARLLKSVQGISSTIEAVDTRIKDSHSDELAKIEELKKQLLQTDNIAHSNNDKLEGITASLKQLLSLANDMRSEIKALLDGTQGISSKLESATATIRSNQTYELAKIEEIKSKLSKAESVAHSNKVLLIWILVISAVVCVGVLIMVLYSLYFN